MFLSFKEKLLKKSNSYNHYKDENERLLEENKALKAELEELKNKNGLRDEYIKLYSHAGSFCNWKYIDYYFRDDFEDKMKEVTKNLDKKSKNTYKWIFLRALSVNLIARNSLYFDHELAEQERFTEFKKNNSGKDEIAGFKFKGDYNLHAFIDLNLRDTDREFLKNKDIIDAGAFTGDTALPLSKITEKNVYAFEPFKDSFELLQKNIEINNIDNIVPVNKSLGNINGERTLYLAGSNVQGITSNPNTRPYDNELKIEETTVDRFVEENNLDVGYITIDVEGAERDLLNGAINTIKTQKPILSISLYHSIDDYFEIIPMIANLNLEYEFEVLKEQPWPFLGDTIVQCRAK